MRYAALVTGLQLLFALGAGAQETARPLVRQGEVLTYRVRSARFGDIGTAIMRVESDSVRGRAAYRLSFDFNARVTLFKVSDQTRSWLDVQSMTTLRYTKSERSPIGKRDEVVDVFTSLGTWTDLKGVNVLASGEPLDELAFIYMVRALDTSFESLEVTRHFDAARNPVHFQNTGRETVTALGENLEADVVQMSVIDPRQKNGRGTLRFYLSCDAARLPLRIDSSMPVAGALTMTLQSVTVAERFADR